VIAAFALYLRQKPEQNKNYPETNQADADEGQIAQDFPPSYHYTIKTPNRKALRWFSADRCNGASIALPPGVDAPFLFFPL
jgi:hypothetical protein